MSAAHPFRPIERGIAAGPIDAGTPILAGEKLRGCRLGALSTLLPLSGKTET
ncbi:hypothetical protein [Sphingomonas hengshuiensis]|uniref:hypothetical protein n=1 Tax=Sphingomonas hengshuiensis TaxID=1609977 RepID=UPI000B0C9435|nr:hypothetical protein [Sphingomonas hengshuiensis]